MSAIIVVIIEYLHHIISAMSFYIYGLHRVLLTGPSLDLRAFNRWLK